MDFSFFLYRFKVYVLLVFLIKNATSCSALSSFGTPLFKFLNLSISSLPQNLFLVCFIAIISTSNLLISFITSIHFMLVPCTFYVAILIFRFLCLVRLEFFLPKFRKFWSGICSIKDFLRVLGCWPNNPTPIWSTRVFLFVRHLSFDLCGKGDPTSSYATAAQLSGSPVYASFSTRHRGNTFREDLCPETLNFEKQDGLTQLSV